MNLVVNALVDYKLCVFFSCFLTNNDSKKQKKFFFLNCDLWDLNSVPLRLWNLRAAIFAFYIPLLARLLDNRLIL